MFQKTSFHFSITPSMEIYNIAKDMHRLLVPKEKGGAIDYIHPAIVTIFGRVSFQNNAAEYGSIWSFADAIPDFTDGISDRKTIEAAKRLGLYKEYRIGPGLLLAGEVAKAMAQPQASREIKGTKDGYGVSIYLSEVIAASRCCIRVWCDINEAIGVYIEELHTDDDIPRKKELNFIDCRNVLLRKQS